MDTIGALLGRIGHLHFLCVHSVFSSYGLGKGQPRILHILSEKGEMLQKEIAQTDRMSPATITVMLQTMEKNGLIERTHDERDRRGVRVKLTQKGRDIEKAVKDTIDKIDSEIIECFTKDEYNTFCCLSTKLAKHLEKEIERRS
ncbi:MAG: MarR family transcriptional regulator [Clostridia bacterium]|nr:MarR family transcriptional regulator [Clostridia bacterium]